LKLHQNAWFVLKLERFHMSVGTILLIILILLLIGAIPTRARFGNAPMGILGVILVVVIILMLLGHI
tara:strand:+ start:5637 stop:5837 length:201 start_codon:yes stop_codon:yes gene_type:complete